ncbi:MAG: cell division FtsA domain-containing protein [Christensenellaceae bacterium]|jgi:cell division protein FtsA
MRNFKTIVEFGTSKISCVAAEQKARHGLEVLGCAQIGYSGIKKSSWVDSEEVFYALEQVVESLEKQVGTRIKTADVGVPGSFLKIVNRNVQMPIHGRVEPGDIETLMEKASHFSVAEDLMLLQDFPAWFLLDDGSVYLDPVDVPTKRLRGCISFVLANKFFLEDAEGLLKHLGIRLGHVIPEPLAQAMVLVPQEKRDSIAVLVDVGYYSTNVSIIYADCLLYFATIPMGGGSISSDIAYAMKVSKETAEQLKRRYSFGMEELSSSSYIYAKDEDGKLKKYPYDLLKEIIDARVEHLALYINKLLRNAEMSIGRRLDVYITGGGINFMAGAGSFFRTASGRAPTLVKVQSTQLQTPDLHAAYAMVQYAMAGYPLEYEVPQKQRPPREKRN